jgi:steroid delta-isomerase
MKAALEAYVAAMNDGDVAGLLALFAPEATIEDPVGTPLRRGAELAAWFRASAAVGAKLRMTAPVRGSWANEAALVFEVEYDADGRRLRTRSLDVCAFDAAGRITSLRAFWGPGDVEDLGPATGG